MDVTVAKHAGFCFGVHRAIDMAFKALEKTKGPIFSLGPIIHNPQVVQKMQDMGLKVVSDIREIPEGTVIFRSHGVNAEEREEATKRRLLVVDATCPFVEKAHEYVRILDEQAYQIVVVGDPNHPEVLSILSYTRGKGVAVPSIEILDTVKLSQRVGIVSQTTQSFKTFQTITTEIIRRSREVLIFNTICDATKIRQEESIRLAGQSDCMIVIGGRNSANTRRLTELCSQVQPCTYHIETVDELKDKSFDGVKKVGVTAGASTPQWLIDPVVDYLKSL
ncbi:MAG: 4-hydroxy-3-methylbut-2-enyl diphosphate reductase [Deltaproteobacteria bacterium]|nr:4-hydroxy-3-methylbut-2-enyl diphosphate reductase [Deltaproteobacteria bacterium]